MTLTPAQQSEIASWPLEDRDHWSERAAIREYDGGEMRDDAEVAAYVEVKRNRERKR